jgi:hypothetical protein
LTKCACRPGARRGAEKKTSIQEYLILCGDSEGL